MHSNSVLRNASAGNSAASQLLFFEIIFAHMKTRPDVDWDAVATKAGYGSPRIARNRFSTIIRKLKSVNDGSPSTVSPSRSQPTKAQEKGISIDGSYMSTSKVTKPKLVGRKKKKKNGEIDFDTDNIVLVGRGMTKTKDLVKEERVFDDMMLNTMDDMEKDSDADYL